MSWGSRERRILCLVALLSAALIWLVLSGGPGPRLETRLGPEGPPSHRPSLESGEEDFDLPFPRFRAPPLGEGRALEGKVETPEGAPLAGAAVIVRAIPDGEPVRAVTGADGRWHTPPLRSGTYRLLAQHSDFAPQDAVVALDEVEGSPPPAPAPALRLERGTPLEVLALGSEGEPVADAEITAERRTEGGARAIRFLGWTDDLGRLRTRIPGAGGDGPLRVRVRAPGRKEAVVEPAGGVIEVRLDAAPALTAQLVDSSEGLPLPVVGALLEREDGEGFVPVPPRGVRLHGLPGEAVLVGLPPTAGIYRLELTALDGRRGRSAPFVFDGERSPPHQIVYTEGEAPALPEPPEIAAVGAAVEAASEEEATAAVEGGTAESAEATAVLPPSPPPAQDVAGAGTPGAEVHGSREEAVAKPEAVRAGIRIRLRTEDGSFYRGTVRVTVARDGTVVHRAEEVVAGALVLPDLPQGEYLLTVEAEGRRARSRLRVGPGAAAKGAYNR